MRKILIAGNWKMHMSTENAREFTRQFLSVYKKIPGIDVCIAAPFTELYAIEEMFAGSELYTAAQNMHYEDEGAFTGEISGAMLKEIGVDYVILGHSERRKYFAETDETVNRKVKKAFEWGIIPIICCGETLEQRQQGLEKHIVRHQVVMALAGCDERDIKKAVIAYEPVWAIGTGRVASPEAAQEMCGFIRQVIGEIYGSDAAESVIIQYGGSVKPENAREILGMPDIDGALVGGASLNPYNFMEIISLVEQ